MTKAQEKEPVQDSQLKGNQQAMHLPHVPQQGEFKRALRLIDALAVVVGSMIGSGIFIVSAEISRQLGSPGWLLAAWALAGVMTVMSALCYAELSAMYPKAGGQYVFLREAYGPLAAFLYGWTLFAVIQSGTIAAVGVGFAKFLGVFVPQIASSNVLLQIAGWKFSATQLVAVLVIALLTYVNCRGIHAAKFIQTTFTVTKVAALFGLIVLGLISADKFMGLHPNFGAGLAHAFQAANLSGKPLFGLELAAVFGLAMVGSLFSCDAWNNITFASEEVHNPEQSLPKSLALGTALVALIYLLANVVYLLILPLHGDPHGTTVLARGIQFAAEDRVGTAAAQVILGPIAEQIMAAAIMISTFGCLNGLILAGPRAYFAMAQDKLFFKKAGELSPKTNVPVFGLILQGVWASLLATSGTYSNLLEYVVFAALAFYVLTVGALFILRRTKADLARPYKTVLYPFMPALYLVLALAIMVGQIYLAPNYCGAGLLIILSGLPAFFFWQKAKHKAINGQT